MTSVRAQGRRGLALKHRRRVIEVCAHCGEPWPCVIAKARDEIVGMFRRAAEKNG